MTFKAVITEVKSQKGGKDNLRKNQDKYTSLVDSQTSTAVTQGSKANQMGMGRKKCKEKYD